MKEILIGILIGFACFLATDNTSEAVGLIVILCTIHILTTK